MGFFGKLRELGKAINEALTPKTIVDHVQERINELEKEMQSGRRFVSIRKIWNWMKENERMRLCSYDRLNERLQEELEKIDKEKKAKDSYDVLGREFPLEDERKEDNSSKEVYESIKKVEDVPASSKMPTERDVRYYGEAFLKNYAVSLPEPFEIVLVNRKSDGIWIAASVEEVDKALRRVKCGGEWHSDFVRYKYNEELLGTTNKPKDFERLAWGSYVYVCDDLNDTPELSVFIGFKVKGESDLRYLSLSQDSCLQYLSNGDTPPFGRWKYMWLADKGNDMD